MSKKSKKTVDPVDTKSIFVPGEVSAALHTLRPQLMAPLLARLAEGQTLENFLQYGLACQFKILLEWFIEQGEENRNMRWRINEMQRKLAAAQDKNREIMSMHVDLLKLSQIPEHDE